VSWPISFNARANHPQHPEISPQSLATLRRRLPRKRLNENQAIDQHGYLIA
jgi:hypothetical protein